MSVAWKNENMGADGELAPTLEGWRLEGIDPPTVIVWCPQCRHYHYHGWGAPFGEPAMAGGHRVADAGRCHPRGYFLPASPEPTPASALLDRERRRPHGPDGAAKRRTARQVRDEHLRAWIAATCRQGVECVAVPSDLYASWTIWAKANGFGVGDFLRFKLRIARLGFHRESGRPWFTGLELIEPGAALLRLQIGEANLRRNNSRAAERPGSPLKSDRKSKRK